MQYPILTCYFIICALAIYYLPKSSKVLVSDCCKSEYRSLQRSQKRVGQEPYCLECKKWCELIEIRR